MPERIQVSEEFIQLLVCLEDVSAQLLYGDNRTHALPPHLIVQRGGIRAVLRLCEACDAHRCSHRELPCTILTEARPRHTTEPVRMPHTCHADSNAAP